MYRVNSSKRLNDVHQSTIISLPFSQSIILNGAAGQDELSSKNGMVYGKAELLGSMFNSRYPTAKQTVTTQA